MMNFTYGCLAGLSFNVATPAKILVVDSDPIFLLEAYEALCERGFAVDVSSRGYEAFQLLREDYYDLLILDWKLTDCTGDLILEEILEDYSAISMRNQRVPMPVIIYADPDPASMRALLSCSKYFDFISVLPRAKRMENLSQNVAQTILAREE